MTTSHTWIRLKNSCCLRNYSLSPVFRPVGLLYQILQVRIIFCGFCLSELLFSVLTYTDRVIYERYRQQKQTSQWQLGWHS